MMNAAIPRILNGHDSELVALRQQLAALHDEARRNEEAWQRAQRHEMAVLEAATLGELMVRLTDDLRSTYRLAAATLVLVDPEKEVRNLMQAEGATPADHPAVVFVDSAHALAPELERGPRLGPFSRRSHAALFPADARLLSVALLPLLRGKCLIGSINMGSDRADRFTAAHATDFLAHLATIAAFGLESVTSRHVVIRDDERRPPHAFALGSFDALQEALAVLNLFDMETQQTTRRSDQVAHVMVVFSYPDALSRGRAVGTC